MAPRGLGDLKFRIRFDKPIEADDPGGTVISGWSTVINGSFERFAAISPLQGGETVAQQRLVGTQPILIFVRYDSLTKTLDPTWRAVELRDGNPVKYYGLKTAEDMERERQFITILAIAGDADA